MPSPEFNDIAVFLAVARERSFTRAAAQLGVSQSALSQTIRGLETRLGLRLLTRTTRRVAPTGAGERLLRAAGPRLDEIDAELTALGELREKPSGTIRITAHDHALRIRGDITESPGSARLPLHVMPGEGPVSMSCSAGLANDVDAGPSPGMTASYNRATVEAVISP